MIVKRSSGIVLFATSLLLQVGCLFPLPIGPSGPPKTWEWEFYQLPPADRLERFSEYSRDEQVDLYLYGMTKMHPRVRLLAQPLAESPDWGTTVRVMTEKLRSVETSASAQEALSWLARKMTTSGVDLRQEHEFLAALEASAEALEDHDPGRWISKNMRVIRAGPDGWRRLEL